MESTSTNVNSNATSPIALTLCFSLPIIFFLWKWKGADFIKYVKDWNEGSNNTPLDWISMFFKNNPPKSDDLSSEGGRLIELVK